MQPTLLPASRFTIEQLTEAYNHTRVDYIVPMPMNTARLREYIQNYDVSIDNSLVAVENGNIIGLGMLGLRENRSWITRLGLVTNQRGKGTGELLMRGLIFNSDKLGIPLNILEVIKGNKPAHQLFQKLGFEDHRELLILRRAPRTCPKPVTNAHRLDFTTCMEHLATSCGEQSWINQTESFKQISGIEGFQVELHGGNSGWMIYQQTVFNISKIMYCTTGTDKESTLKEMLTHLHTRFPNKDTYTENISARDPHLPAFIDFGYIETFRRIEMLRYPNL